MPLLNRRATRDPHLCKPALTFVCAVTDCHPASPHTIWSVSYSCRTHSLWLCRSQATSSRGVALISRKGQVHKCIDALLLCGMRLWRVACLLWPVPLHGTVNTACGLSAVACTTSWNLPAVDTAEADVRYPSAENPSERFPL